VKNKAFLEVFRIRKMGKAFLSGKRAFSSGVFAVRISGGPRMGIGTRGWGLRGEE
jgi:hypothetical protein